MTWELYGIADRNHACIDGSRATYQIGDNSFISIKKKKNKLCDGQLNFRISPISLNMQTT